MLCRKRHSFYQALRATGHPNPITTKHNIGTKIEINTDMPGLRPEPFFEELDTQTVPVRITQAVSNTQKRVISAGGAWPFVANQAPMRTYQTRRGEVLNASVRSEPFRVSIKRSRGVLGVARGIGGLWHKNASWRLLRRPGEVCDGMLGGFIDQTVSH